MKTVTVLGAGLAGSECAWQLAKRGINVKLMERKPVKMTPAHTSPNFAELVCSNSLRSDELTNAVGLLKAEMRAMGSLIMESADANKVAAGGALAVDREGFSKYITDKLKSLQNVEVVSAEATEIPEGEVVIATGPLSSDAIAEKIAALCPDSDLHFYDAVAPIVTLESVDMDSAFFASRYDKGTADYVNCPMDKDEYLAFVEELTHAKEAEVHGFDDGGGLRRALDAHRVCEQAHCAGRNARDLFDRLFHTCAASGAVHAGHGILLHENPSLGAI